MSSCYYDDASLDNERYMIVFYDLIGDAPIVRDDYNNIPDDICDFAYIEVRTKDNETPSRVYIGKETTLENILLQHQKYDCADDLVSIIDSCLEDNCRNLVIIENDIIPTPSGLPGCYKINPELDRIVSSKKEAVETAKNIVKVWLEEVQI